MPGAVKLFGLLVVNVVVAVIGTATLTIAVGQALHPHSLGAILWKEWSLSIGCAAAIGFGMWRTWRSPVAHWTWVIPTLWFGAKFILAIGEVRCWFNFLGKRASVVFAQADASTGSPSPSLLFAAFSIHWALTQPPFFMATDIPKMRLCGPQSERNS
jgi:hypothetical protein